MNCAKPNCSKSADAGSNYCADHSPSKEEREDHSCWWCGSSVHKSVASAYDAPWPKWFWYWFRVWF